MFAEHINHRKNTLFGITTFLPEHTRKTIEKSWAVTFYDEVFCKINENDFALMYSQVKSRPNTPVNILLSLEILKGIYNLTDLELMENFGCNLLYMTALGMLKVGEISVSDRTIYQFRARLLKFMSKEENADLIKQLFNNLTDNFIDKANISTKIQRTDSSMIRANIKKLRRYELVVKVMSNIFKILTEEEKKSLPLEITEIITKSEKESIFKVLSGSVDENFLLKVISMQVVIRDAFKNNDRVKDTIAYKQLERLLKEQTQVNAETKEIEIKAGKDIASDSLQNPSDEDATYRKKAGKEHQGYLVNIMETASKDNKIQMITDVVIEQNIKSDAGLLEKELESVKKRTGLEQVVADGAYRSDSLEEEADKLKVEIITTALTGEVPDETKIPIHNFVIGTENIIEVCPNNIKPQKSEYDAKNDQYVAYYSKKDCENCPLKDKCYIDKKQKKENVIRVTSKKIELSKIREIMQTEEFKKIKNLRPAIEGTFSALKKKYGLAVAVSRTLERVRYFVMFKIIGCNFNRFFRALTGISVAAAQ